MDSMDWQDYQERAKERWEVGNVHGAEADFTQAIALQPENPMLYFSRAQFYLEEKHFGDAIEDYTATIKLMPRNPMFYVARCKAYTQIGQLDRAIEDCTQALTIARRHKADIYHRRGTLHMVRGDYENAIADFTSAESSGSHSHRHALERAAAYERTGDVDSAIADLEKVINLCDPDDPDTQTAQEHIDRLRLQTAAR